MAKVTIDPAGCWLWTGYIQPTGYAYFQANGLKRDYAHRWAYTHFRGAIPEGMQIDHVCRVRNCVNPSHLEPVTSLENIRRSPRGQLTHCPEGHEYGPRQSGRRRRCLICKRQRQNTRNQARSRLAREAAPRLEALERRVAALEAIEATVERLCRIAAHERDIAADRIRELELAS